MTSLMKILGGAGALIVAALVGGTLIGSVLAAPTGSSADSPSPALIGDETDATAYCQTFLDTFASELGVSTDDLVPAAKTAAIAAVNAAVDAGDLTQERADAIIERINNWDGNGCGWIGFHLGGPGHGPKLELLSGMFSAAADTLGMTNAELRDALVDSTLEEVAADQGVAYDDVVAAALSSAKTDLDAAVSAGTITQDRADAIYDQLQTWLNSGDIGNWGDGPGRFGHFPGMHFAPNSSDSSSNTSTEGTSA